MVDVFPALAAALKAQRDSLNARFAQRVRGGARIEGESFLAHLREKAAPLVQSVHANYPERVPAVVNALYDASLDLFAASLLGENSRVPGIHRVWTELLPRNIELLAREPVGIVGCLCNGAFQVAQQRGTRLELWLDRMRNALAGCDSPGRVLEVGQVAAWQAGMAQYRQPALEVAGRLPPGLATLVLGLAAETSQDALASALVRLRQNPWLSAEEALQPEPALLALASVGMAGSFTGFGGVFARPPVVTCSAGRLLASDGRSRWQLIADAYGSWFRRLPEEKVAASKLPAGVVVDRRGNLKWGALAQVAPHLASATGAACDGVTLAVTIPTSHHVFLFARRRGPL